MTRNIFVAATRQNDGKTMFSLGLISALKNRFGRVGFIKPVGQRYVEVDGSKIDEDSVLVEKVCGLDCRLADMSPIAVERDFTVKYIDGGNPEKLIKQIKDSYEMVSKGKAITVIEGTGHAGVGSVFDLSNATVARLLNSKVVLVTIGGIGRPIDEILLNKALFEKEGVELIGVIINKVLPEKYDKILHYAGKGLKRKGVELLGAIPYMRMLSSPTMATIFEEIGGDILNGEESMDARIDEIMIGAMTPHQALNYFHSRTLVITPGDREDLILGAMSSAPAEGTKKYGIGGMILTGQVRPHESIMKLLHKTHMPVLAINKDTYSVASRIHDMIVKIGPSDREKISVAMELVEKHVAVDRLLEKI